nr:AAA family ATPase [Halomonas sp. TG39a]
MGCLFEGRDHLFEDLYIHDKWDWQQQYPVVRLSFGSGVANSREDLDANIRYQLQQQRKKLNIETPPPERIADNFASLLENARSVHGQCVVVLIDEYDKPILDNLLNTERARELREGLKNL